MSQSVTYAAVSAPAEPIVSVPVADACCDLLELFAGVSDGRTGPGRDHPVAAVLALAAAAVVAGMRGYTAITGWVADVPPAILAGVYLRSGAAAAPYRVRWVVAGHRFGESFVTDPLACWNVSLRASP